MTVIAMIVLATYEERQSVLIALVGAFPLVFLLGLVRERLDNLAWGVSATIFGICWIGLPLAHAVFLRELPHGQTLLVDVLIATFIGDTAAYLGGRAWGRTPLAPDISPNKTLEGLAAGRAGRHDRLLGRRDLLGLADRAPTRWPSASWWPSPRRWATCSSPRSSAIWRSRTPARCSDRTVACWTAWTPCSSRSWWASTPRWPWATASAPAQEIGPARPIQP